MQSADFLSMIYYSISLPPSMPSARPVCQRHGEGGGGGEEGGGGGGGEMGRTVGRG